MATYSDSITSGVCSKMCSCLHHLFQDAVAWCVVFLLLFFFFFLRVVFSYKMAEEIYIHS